MIRWMVIAVVALAALWSGWWIVGSVGVARGVEASATQARERGWEVAWQDLSVSGFPNRFDTTLTEPTIASPDGWRWTAPFLQVFALSYRPNHGIAVAPETQVIEGAFGVVEVASEDMRASVVVAPDTSLSLRRATATAEGLRVEGGFGAVTVGGLRAALREAGEARYDVAVGAERIGLPASFGASTLPSEVASLSLDATVILDRPLDRTMEGSPFVTGVDLRGLALRWGDVEATVSGALEAGVDGLAQGTIRLDLADLDGTLAALEGALPAETLDFAARFLREFTVEGETGAVRVDLPVADGAIALGPVRLFKLPRFGSPGS